jgi:hypothetical protein
VISIKLKFLKRLFSNSLDEQNWVAPIYVLLIYLLIAFVGAHRLAFFFVCKLTVKHLFSNSLDEQNRGCPIYSYSSLTTIAYIGSKSVFYHQIFCHPPGPSLLPYTGVLTFEKMGVLCVCSFLKEHQR